jgi:hypothetical protein
MLLSSTPAYAGPQPPPRPLVDASGMLRVDRIYFELAAKTEGEMHFWADGEFLERHADVGTPVGGNTIAARYGEVSAGGTVEVAVDVPVDPKLGAVRFFAAVQKKERVTLTRPDGRAVTSSDEGVERVDTRFMTFVTASDPQPGTWKLAIAGQGLFQAAAQAFKKRENYDDLLFRFVRVGGRPGHEGLFPVRGVPAAGSESLCSATIDPDLEAVTFTFEDASGKALDTLALVEERDPASVELSMKAGAGPPPHRFFGDCRVPSGPFRFVARGVDRAGKRYEERTSLMRPRAAE